VEAKKPRAQTAAVRPITLKKIDPTKKPDSKSDLELKKQELIQKINSMSSIEQLKTQVQSLLPEDDKKAEPVKEVK